MRRRCEPSVVGREARVLMSGRRSDWRSQRALKPSLWRSCETIVFGDFGQEGFEAGSMNDYIIRERGWGGRTVDQTC